MILTWYSESLNLFENFVEKEVVENNISKFGIDFVVIHWFAFFSVKYFSEFFYNKQMI